MEQLDEEIPWTPYHATAVRNLCGCCGGAMTYHHVCFMPMTNDIRRIVREELARALAPVPQTEERK